MKRSVPRLLEKSLGLVKTVTGSRPGRVRWTRCARQPTATCAVKSIELTKPQDIQAAQVESAKRQIVHSGLSDLVYRGDELPEEVCCHHSCYAFAASANIDAAARPGWHYSGIARGRHRRRRQRHHSERAGEISRTESLALAMLELANAKSRSMPPGSLKPSRRTYKQMRLL